MNHTSDAILGCYGRYDLSFVKGDGAYLYDAQGNDYLDFASGVAVNSLGHNHPKMLQALTAQAQKLWHSSNLYHNDIQQELAQRLVESSFADKVFFCNSGLEANEAMIKMARRYHFLQGKSHKYQIITLEGAFHGRSLATLAATGKAQFLEGMGPVLEGFIKVPPHDISAMENAIINDDIAAIMVEPILGEGGIIPLGKTYLQQLRQLCNKHGILLLLDEVQVGVGRTGTLWAHQHADITPDAMSSAKGLGGGFPIGALLATDKLAQSLGAGMHGCTFGGNHLACSVAIAVLDEINQPTMLAHITRQGDALSNMLQQLCQKFPDKIAEIRGRGLMVAIKLTEKYSNQTFIKALHQQYLLTVPAADNIIRLLPPLMIDEQHLAQAQQKLVAGLEKITEEMS